MFSWVALDRFAEKERARDRTFRKQSARKVLRSDAQQLTDDDLLAKLRSFGIELDRPSLERLCREALSAEEIATPLLDQHTFHGRQAEMERDWIWVCLTALWQRWFPDQLVSSSWMTRCRPGMTYRVPEEPRPLATSGLRRGETCSVCSIKGVCNRSMPSTNDFEDRNRCSIGFRIWKTRYGMQDWKTGSC
jgi:hypothetical protein